MKSEPNHYSCQHDSRHNQGHNNNAFYMVTAKSTMHRPLVLVGLCNLSRKRVWCQVAEKFWTLLDGMTGCLECQRRRLQNDGVWWKLPAWNGWTNAAGKRLAVQRVMSSQGLGTCGQSLWALGGLMALIGAHSATRPSPIALPNAGQGSPIAYFPSLFLDI